MQDIEIPYRRLFMFMKTCFVCLKELLPSESSHVSYCAKEARLGLGNKEIKFKQIQHQVPNVTLTREWLHQKYTIENCTITNFKKQFSILSKQLSFLLDYFKIPQRSKDTVESLRKASYNSTIMDKYGTTSHNHLPQVKEAKRIACMKKYGVDNVAKSPEIIAKGIKTKIQKYGTASLTFRNKTIQEKRDIMQHAWNGSEKWRNNLSIEDKERIGKEISKRIRAWHWGLTKEEKLALLHKRRSFTSKLEDRVHNAIKSIDVSIKRQCWIDRLSYDFKIGHNIILEINGDYWHANPILYEHNDIIPFPNSGLRVAEDIWEKDKLKKEKAESYGYKVFYLWESELNNMTDDEINKFVNTLIVEHNKPLNSTDATY